jgi:DNA-binding SARP family transcriptional activator
LLRLRTLGTTALLRDDVLLGGSAAQKRRLALLAVLAVAGDRGISRDRLAALLWPERDEEQARHSLSQWLYTTRRELNADGLILGTADLRLNPQCIASDVSDFERALAAGELEPAIASYAGPFLDGFHVAGTDEFDRWADLERGRLSALYHGALEKLACRREDAGDYQAAAETWRRLAALDPYNGRVSLSLMRALSASGDAAGALTHARVHATLLKEELGAEAQPEVLAYAAELRVAPPAPRTVRGVPPAPVAEPRAPEAPPAAGPAHVAAPAAPEPAATRRARPAGAAVLAAGLLLVATIAAGYRALPQDWRAGVRTLAGRPDATFVSRRIVVVPFDNRPAIRPCRCSARWPRRCSPARSRRPGSSRWWTYAPRGWRTTWSIGSRGRSVPRDRLVALAAETQAAYILSGSYYRAGEMLRVVAQVTDAAGRKVPRPPVTMTGSVRQPWALVDSVTRRALPMAIALVDTAWTGATVAVTSPPSADAYRELSAAWEAYFAANVPEAIVRARRAAALDTGFMAPLALQAHVHAEDRDWARVDSLVEAIQRHEARLSPLERAVASTYQAAARGDLAGQLVAALDVVRHARRRRRRGRTPRGWR